MAKAIARRSTRTTRRAVPPAKHDELKAVDLTGGSPDIGAPGMAHALEAMDINVQPPVIKVPPSDPALLINTGRPRALNSDCVTQMQSRLEAHLRAEKIERQGDAVDLVQRWLQESGRTPSRQLIERKIVRPVWHLLRQR
jgi:hypothetical protein